MHRRASPLLRTVCLALTAPVAVLVLGGGCRDATQVTLEIELRGDIPCADVGGGTAITVGTEPAATEARVGRGDITTKTHACDPATRRIGTLVVTPGETGRAAVVVVVGFRGIAPEACKPPAYEGCIVARRRFTFADHASLRMPITIDPACASVGCDAETTCRQGLCFSSETPPETCDDGVCDQPGELPGGGTSDASFAPDVGSRGDGGPVLPDADAPDGGFVVIPLPPRPTTAPSCDDDGNLYCYTAPGKITNCVQCCDTGGGGLEDHAQCLGGGCDVHTTKHCCSDANCPPDLQCQRGLGQPPAEAGRCLPRQGYGCVGTSLFCPETCVPGQWCCAGSGGPGPAFATCQDPSSPGCTTTRYCCSAADCAGCSGGSAVKTCPPT